MEKESLGNALVVALTYNEESEHSRRSAQVFDYKDVQDFLKNLRRQVQYHLGRTGAVSFVACGERGDRFDRCHWHLVLFAQVDLIPLGKWFAPWGQVFGARDIVSPPGIADPWRRSWSLWPHGFVTVQEPDYGGFRYAMSYALKDQFSVSYSEGTGRYASSEVFGEGYFVPSKNPPLGQRWVDSYIDRCAAEGVVPPTLALPVSGLRRPFWPSGLLADRALCGFRAVNHQFRQVYGRDAPGWSTLVAERADNENHLVLLGVSDGKEERPKENPALHRFREGDGGKIESWAEKRRRYNARQFGFFQERLAGQIAGQAGAAG